MMAENVVLTDEMRDELFNYALDVMWDHNDIFGKLKEENRYFNWYNGFTEVKSLKYQSHYGLQYFIDTTAPRGVVTTQHFGQHFQPLLVDKAIEFKVFVYPPEIKKNANITLHFKMEKVVMTELTSSRFDRYFMEEVGYIDSEITIVSKNFTNPSAQRKLVRLWRYVGTSDLETMSLETMPGFIFSWWYTGGNINAEPKYSEYRMNKMFVK